MDSVSAMISGYRAAQALVATVLLGTGCKPAGPRVQIVSPARGAIVSGSVLVALRAPGLHVVPADGSRKAGEGHFHVLVDVSPPGGDSVIPTGRGIYHLGKGTDTVTVPLAGLAPGTHYLVGVFAYGDHLPLKEVAADTVRIVVRLP